MSDVGLWGINFNVIFAVEFNFEVPKSLEVRFRLQKQDGGPDNLKMTLSTTKNLNLRGIGLWGINSYVIFAVESNFEVQKSLGVQFRLQKPDGGPDNLMIWYKEDDAG